MISILVLIVIISLIYLLYKKKIMSRKKIIISIVVVISIILLYKVIILINHNMVKTYTIEEIANINFDDIAYVYISYDKKENVLDEFKNKFKNMLFRKDKYIDEKIEENFFPSNFSGAPMYYSYICYDEKNNVLCTITDKRK